MNLTWDGGYDRRQLSMFCNTLVLSTIPSPAPSWPGLIYKRVSWQALSGSVRNLIPLRAAGPVAFDEVINSQPWTSTPADWLAVLDAPGHPILVALGDGPPPMLDAFASRPAAPFTLCPEWYYGYPAAFESLNQLASRGLLPKSCPLWNVSNRPDLGPPYDGASSNRGLKGYEQTLLQVAAASYGCYNAGVWGANYRALDVPAHLRDDAIVRFDAATMLALWR